MVQISRDIPSGSEYDLIVIGAGINGAATAREAALNGLSVLLLDRADVGGETSAWNTRLIHGGLRYLQYGEIPLVYESLTDRETLLHIAPHLVSPLGFVVPDYRHHKIPGWMIRVGMLLYDTLSWGKSMPRHRRLSKLAAQTELPGLEVDGLRGGAHYYDGQVPYAERLVLETILDAVSAGAHLRTYTKVTQIDTEAGVAIGVTARDTHTGDEFSYRGRVVINAAGPWVDQLAAPLGLERMIGGTKGTHLIVNPFPGAPHTAIYFEARSDNRPILIVPWLDRYLIGTTDDHFEGELAQLEGTPDEVAYLLSETNALIPKAHLTEDDVLQTYAGVRPLPYRPDAKPGAIPRSHLIVEHESIRHLITIVGGKLTPHLALGEDVLKTVSAVLSSHPVSKSARHRPLPGAGDEWKVRCERALAELDLPVPVSTRLRRVYGGRTSTLAALVNANPELGRLIGQGDEAILAAEIPLACNDEGAYHLVDILHRRTMVGLEAGHGLAAEAELAAVAGQYLGWDEARQKAEIAEHRAYLARLHGGLPRPEFSVS